MSRKFRDMEPPEAAYLRRHAAAAAQRSREAEHKHAGEAEKWQMTVDVYGREGKDYSDPQLAADAAAKRDRHLEQADRHRAEAARHDALATPPAPKKKGWWRS